MKDLKLWMAISNLRNIPHSLLLYSRIIDFTENLFEISEDEDEYEVLRRVITHFYINYCIGLKLDILYGKDESL